MKHSLALLVLLIFAAPACTKKATQDECNAILDRYLDLSMIPNPELSRMLPQQIESVVSAQKAERRTDSSFLQARTRCEAEVSHAQIDCAMQAPTANDWEACLD
ncbi:MAG: hypothetical protein ABI461_22890 [Polyangiaceae bacterium]